MDCEILMKGLTKFGEQPNESWGPPTEISGNRSVWDNEQWHMEMTVGKRQRDLHWHRRDGKRKRWQGLRIDYEEGRVFFSTVATEAVGCFIIVRGMTDGELQFWRGNLPIIWGQSTGYGSPKTEEKFDDLAYDLMLAMLPDFVVATHLPERYES